MKDSFVVNYAVKLWLTSMGVSGFFGGFLSFIAVRVLGSMIDKGLIVVDIKIDKLKEALKDPEWRDAAKKAYDLASARVYTEAEKDEIRKQYQKALAAYATYGDGLQDGKHP